MTEQQLTFFKINQPNPPLTNQVREPRLSLYFTHRWRDERKQIDSYLKISMRNKQTDYVKI